MLEYFSYSRLSTFSQCPARFKIQYIDKIECKTESIEAFVGIQVHEVLEFLYNQKNRDGKTPLLDTLLDIYRQIWEKKWHDQIAIFRYNISWQEYYRLGEKCIAWYYRTFHPFDEPVLGIEHPFDLELLDGIRFKGFIDRVDQLENGDIVIHDYKTGKRAMSQQQADKDLQLSIYQLAMEKELASHEGIYLTWHFLQVGRSVTSTRTPTLLETHVTKITDQVNQIVSRIKNGSEFEPKEGFLCNWCYYWEECPAKYSHNPAIRSL